MSIHMLAAIEKMKKAVRDVLIIVGLGLVLVFGFYKLGRMFAPGSYPFAETYEIDMPESQLIEIINNFKQRNPEYNQIGSLQDGRRNSSEYWYHLYFSYPQEDIIALCWTRPETATKTTFAFVRLGNMGNWKEINDDFGFVENREAKRVFEERILTPIQKEVKEKR